MAPTPPAKGPSAAEAVGPAADGVPNGCAKAASTAAPAPGRGGDVPGRSGTGDREVKLRRGTCRPETAGLRGVGGGGGGNPATSISGGVTLTVELALRRRIRGGGEVCCEGARAGTPTAAGAGPPRGCSVAGRGCPCKGRKKCLT
mmetsp:Transcript_94966/g.268233  ORF Transcript_94966/g.268233 Transcript_94966/m.268233 type:complete len:145 (-) Transcript_94966:735-1169(-)